MGAETPLGRLGHPGGLAGIFVTLAQEDSSLTIGQVFGGRGRNRPAALMTAFGPRPHRPDLVDGGVIEATTRICAWK